MMAYFLAALLVSADPTAMLREASKLESAERYAEALTLYTRISEEAGESYAARPAEGRREDLAAHADHGFVPYARYQRLLKEYVKNGSEASVAEARSIVAAFPNSAVAPEALFWIGNEFRETGRKSQEAMAAYRGVADKYPESSLAPIALDRMGRMAERAGQLETSKHIYAELEKRYPHLSTPQAFAERRMQLVRMQWRKRGAMAARVFVALAVILFFVLGGWRVDRRRLWGAAIPKMSFALFMGLAPAAFLWLYDDIWSPSLSILGIVFAGYGIMLTALAARRSPPPGTLWIYTERAVFNVLAPLSILYLLIHAFKLWPVFGL